MNINEIDGKILELFQVRMKLSEESLKENSKINSKVNGDVPDAVQNIEAERETLYRMCLSADEPFKQYAKILFGTIFDMEHSYRNSLIIKDSPLKQKISEAVKAEGKSFPLTAIVACQGVEGAYSQIAADRIFGAARILYMRTFESVFNAVDKGLCQYGVLPIENSTAGSVTAVYDLMKKYKFSIARSVRQRINHTLLARKDTELKKIKEIFSHEQAISQCSEFLKNNPGIKVTVCENTAAAAKMVAESGRDDIAAISSKNCAENYNLISLSDNIQNSDNNYTRFICISKDLEIYEGADKISLIMMAENKAGSLYNILRNFSMFDLNLTKLESRPIPGTDFEFMFYFDVDGSVKDENVLNFISQMSLINGFTFLGNYSEIG